MSEWSRSICRWLPKRKAINCRSHSLRDWSCLIHPRALDGRSRRALGSFGLERGVAQVHGNSLREIKSSLKRLSNCKTSVHWSTGFVSLCGGQKKENSYDHLFPNATWFDLTNISLVSTFIYRIGIVEMMGRTFLCWYDTLNSAILLLFFTLY